MTAWLVLLSGLFAAALALFALVAKCIVVVRVSGNSMQPALEHGTKVLALKYFPRRRLRCGQIVTMNWERLMHKDAPAGLDLSSNKPLIKRLGGLPGDWLLVPDGGGSPARRLPDNPGEPPPGFRQVQVPPGHCFLCSDNAEQGSDSRLWGCIPVSALTGVVVSPVPPAAAVQSGNVIDNA